MYLGIYTLEIIALFILTTLTLTITLFEKNPHMVIPIKINTGKYFSEALNTTPNMTA
jgi:hypothetical protein